MTKPRRITSSEGHYGPFLSNIKGQVSHPVIQQDVNRLKVNFAWKLEEELFSSWIPDQEIKVKSRELDSLKSRDHDCSHDLSKDSQKSALKVRRQSLIKRESSLPAIGRSMAGGGEGPSVAEVATSFPARLLGAIEELRKLSNFFNGKERGRRRVKVSKNFK